MAFSGSVDRTTRLVDGLYAPHIMVIWYHIEYHKGDKMSM